MSELFHDPAIINPAAGMAEVVTDVQRQDALLKTGALQSAIFNSAMFSKITTDAKGVIQIFNVGAERMRGYAATDVVHKTTPADIYELTSIRKNGSHSPGIVLARRMVSRISTTFGRCFTRRLSLP